MIRVAVGSCASATLSAPMSTPNAPMALKSPIATTASQTSASSRGYNSVEDCAAVKHGRVRKKSMVSTGGDPAAAAKKVTK